MYFFEILENIMRDRNLKISDISKMTDIPDSTLRSIINRKNKTVALDVAFKISKGLNIPIEELNGEILSSYEIISKKDDDNMKNRTRKIKEEIKKQYGSIRKFCEIANIPSTTLTSALSNDIGCMGFDKVAKVCEILNLDILTFDRKKNNYNFNKISNKEEHLLSSFNKLNHFGQEKAIERVEELTQIEKYTIDNVSEELCVTRLDIKDIQLYEIPASAGTGMLITDDVPYEIKQIDLTIAPQARKADFALYVRGDSMEPSYYDGDIIFIKSQPAVDNGQIGIFIYDDESYIKKYSVQEDGAYLISLNKKYEPIKIDENLNFKVCGLVL